MRSTWLIYVACAVGFVLLLGIGVAISDGADNKGDTVKASNWADDVCGTVGSWEGQLEAIGDDVKHEQRRRASITTAPPATPSRARSTSARPSTVRSRPPTTRCRRDCERAGIPEASGGAQAAAALLDWAQLTENALLAAEQSMRQKPNTTSAAFASLGTAVKALELAPRSPAARRSSRPPPPIRPSPTH